jgi:hypothetical protein
MKIWKELKIKLTGFVVVSFVVSGSVVYARHPGQDMSNMPGMSKAKPKPKSNATPQKKKKATKKKQVAKKHDMGNMPGMNMPGMKMPGRHRRKVGPPTRKARAPKSPANKNEMDNMPGMPAKPSSSPKQSATPQASPQQMQMNMPGMQMPSASPNPQASPEQKMNMPGMQMPQASPNPQASPQPKMDMNMPMPAASPSPGAMSGMKGMPGMDSPDMGQLLVMSGGGMAVRVGPSETNLLYCGQMGSGTSWEPHSSQLHMWDKVAGGWVFMFHFNAIAGVNSQGGPRGVTKFESANWFMPMAFHKLGKGTLQLRGMFSLEPFTFAPGGSPLLLQTGETYKGQPIIDKQHPHDFWMELSAQYTLPVGERGTWFTYFGYPGEPALGPPAFMHRESASENPAATLAHHLQDSTHVSFGVLTTGFTYRWFKLEGSVFNGHEPDENRYNFEVHTWNSRSARFSFAPNDNWTMQVSYGFLRQPEAAEPTTDIRRATASIQYNKPFKRANWSSALIWGRNHTSSPSETHNLNGYTAESTVNFLDKNYFYTRLELVDKNELLRAADRAKLGLTQAHPSFRIRAYTFGGVRDVWNTEKLSLGIGSDVTFYSTPAVLDRIYGNNPVSWRLFLRLRPHSVEMNHAGSH